MPSLFTIQRSAICLALLTVTGILVHDTKLDKAAVTALAIPAVLASFDIDKVGRLGGTDHTHVERVSFSQAVNIVGNGTPRITPRDDHKKFHMTKKVAKGTQTFDGYYLPDFKS